MRTVNQCGRCGARDEAAHKPGCIGRKVKTLVYGRADLDAAKAAGYDKRPDNIRVYDNGGIDNGGTVDRYTIIRTTPVGFRDYETAHRHNWCAFFAYVGASAQPYHPQGIGMGGETVSRPLWNAGKWGARKSDMPAHVRERYVGARWADLPLDVRRCACELAFDDNEP